MADEQKPEPDVELKTLVGVPATFDRCPYLDTGPHTFIVLFYAPGQVLQMICQHCLMLSTHAGLSGGGEEPEDGTPGPLVN
jgi:hypothetical protein